MKKGFLLGLKSYRCEKDLFWLALALVMARCESEGILRSRRFFARSEMLQSQRRRDSVPAVLVPIYGGCFFFAEKLRAKGVATQKHQGRSPVLLFAKGIPTFCREPPLPCWGFEKA